MIELRERQWSHLPSVIFYVWGETYIANWRGGEHLRWLRRRLRQG